jgi:hypothetical protein
MSDYQPVHRCQHFNMSRCCTILYRVRSYEPPSHLPPPLINTTPAYHHYSCTVFVNTTLALQSVACLFQVTRQVTEYFDRNYPNCWIGQFGPQAWPVRSPDVTPLGYVMRRRQMKDMVYQQQSQKRGRTIQRIMESADRVRRNYEIIRKATSS